LLINDKEKNVNVNVVFIGNYLFEDKDDTNFENFLYRNAPSILFPYIRAYISSLTCLSGIAPVTLPTMNLIDLIDELKANITEV